VQTNPHRLLVLNHPSQPSPQLHASILVYVDFLVSEHRLERNTGFQRHPRSLKTLKSSERAQKLYFQEQVRRQHFIVSYSSWPFALVLELVGQCDLWTTLLARHRYHHWNRTREELVQMKRMLEPIQLGGSVFWQSSTQTALALLQW